MLGPVPQTANPHRKDITAFLRRARCHYGATLLYEEAGLTVDEAARELGISRDQVSSCRRGVRRVLDDEFAANKTQASYDQAVLRSLMHFRDEMTNGLREHVDTRLAGLRTTFKLTTGVEPLRCKYGFDSSARSTAPPYRRPVPSGADGQLPKPETDSAPDTALEASAVTDNASADGPEYATGEEIQLVDDLAMELALAQAARLWPQAEVRRMPHSNPGYDIEVRHAAGDTRYVEVKGTRSPDPCFFITAGEVVHSQKHPERYSIWIFHAMDLDLGTATLAAHDGPVTAEHFELQPVQYRGRFKGTR